MDTLDPLIRQFLDAKSHAERADHLLRLPDAHLLKYAHVYRQACQRVEFHRGWMFVESRRSVLHATRDADGFLAEDVLTMLDDIRQEMVRVVACGDA